ncbi:MAG: glycosyltransferase family 2 protein [Candidatus Melainabacteria bacterium]
MLHTASQPPRLTFLVPCYNYGHFLAHCVAAIARQTFTDWELLILDDASTDDTPQVAARLADNDHRIRVIRHSQNIGHLANYNLGIREARGELIWLISADDALADPTVAQEFVTQFEQHPNLTLAFCRVQCMDDHGTPYDKFIPRQPYPRLPQAATVFQGADFFRRLIHENFVPAPAALARKASYERHGFFHPDLPHSGDWYNWLMFALDGAVYFQPEAKVHYRKHASNMHVTYDKPRHALENTLLCYQTIEQQLAASPHHAALLEPLKLARLQFMKKHDFPLTLPETITRFTAKLAGHYR